VLAAVLSLSVAGCGTTATILQTDGEQVEGRITGGSFDEVWLLDPKGREHRIARNQIHDIAHPGNVAVGVGAAFVVLGLLRLYDSAPHCAAVSEGACLQAYVPAAIGLGMAAWGGMVYSRSVHRAEQGLAKPSEQPAPPVRAPSPFSSSPPVRSLPVPPPPALVPVPPAARAPAGALAPPPAAPAPPPAPTTPLPAVPQRFDDGGT
jgi:hypothetical protein